MQDAELVTRCQRGDQRAMRQLYVGHSGRVFALAMRLLANREDAEDVLQETFLKAWRSIDSFKKRSGFGTWLYRIAVNCCRDLQRRRRPQPPPQDELATLESGDVFARHRLEQALEKLSQGYREVLVLHDVMELAHPDIAQVLGIEVGTSKSQLHKARAKMRHMLQHQMNVPVAQEGAQA